MATTVSASADGSDATDKHRWDGPNVLVTYACNAAAVNSCGRATGGGVNPPRRADTEKPKNAAAAYVHATADHGRISA